MEVSTKLAVMEIADLHPWDLSPRVATQWQEKLRGRLVLEDRFRSLHTVAGLDVGYDPKQGRVRAAVTVLGFPGLDIRAESTAERPCEFPYIPGLLSFREMPALLAALARLDKAPDLLMCDGHGLAHPRRFGLACHLGIILDAPTVGVAKNHLIGSHKEVSAPRGSWQPLIDGREVIGAVLRTRSRVRPVYVSVGHRMSLETAIQLVLKTCPKFRLPEPLRRAHQLASGNQRGGKSQR